MSVLFIAEIAEVTAPARYAEYVRQVPAVIARQGGKYLVQGGKPRTVFGTWNPSRLIVIEFPDEAAAKACFESEDYQRIAPLRELSTRSRAVIVDRCEAGD
jgi:uncharacterized protein (DUF1330 family)